MIFTFGWLGWTDWSSGLDGNTCLTRKIVVDKINWRKSHMNQIEVIH